MELTAEPGPEARITVASNSDPDQAEHARRIEDAEDDRATVDLSVVVPVYNSAEFIARTLDQLGKHLATGERSAELIVIDDGSTDATAEIVAALAGDAAIPLRLERLEDNHGKGHAVATGMALAGGHVRVFIDADLPFPPRAIDELCAELERGADVAVASRVHPESEYVVKPSFFRYLYTRHLAGRLFNLLVRVLLLPGLRDSQAGLKGFTAAAAEQLFSAWMPRGFGFDLAILARARHTGLGIVQLPVRYRYDREPTTVRFLSDTARMLRDLVSVRVRIGGPTAMESLRELSEWARLSLEHTDRSMSRPLGRSVVIAAGSIALLGLLVTRLWAPNGVLAVLAWLVALAGLILLARGEDATGRRDDPGPPIDTPELLLFAGILVLAGMLRAWDLDQAPAMIHGDSAECGLQGLEILRGRVHDVFDFSDWYFTPYLAYLPYALSFGLFGVTVLALRLPSVILGIACVIPLYLLVRGWYGPRIAQISTLLFAFSHSAIHFSRIGLWNIQALFLELFCFAMLFGALRRHRMVMSAGAGIAAGLALYSYTAGRLVIVVAVAFLALRFLQQRGRDVSRVAGYFLIGTLLTAVPLALNYVKSPEILHTDRSASVLILDAANRRHMTLDGAASGLPEILWRQTVTTLAGFVSIGDASGQYGTTQPLLSRLTAVLAVIGLALTVWRIRRPESQFVLLWLFFGLALSSILVIDPPFHPRMLVIFPVPCILAAIAVGDMLRGLSRRGRVLRWAAATAAIALIAQAAVFDLSGYRRYLDRIDVLVTEWDVIEVFERVGTDQDFYLFGGPTITVLLPGLRLFGENRRVVIGFSPRDVPRELVRDTVFIAVSTMLGRHAQLLDLGGVISARFPQTHREVTYSLEQPQLVLYYSSPIGGSTDAMQTTRSAFDGP